MDSQEAGGLIMARGRGGQGNKGRGRKNRGPGKSRKKRVSRKRKQPTRRPRKISSKTKKKISSDRKNSLRNKLKKKIASKTLKGKLAAKGLTKKTETKKKTISASQSRRQVRQKTKDKIATRKKINTPSLGRIGRTLRNIRQPIAGLSSMAINSVIGRPGIASTIAQAAVNNLGKQNQRTRDMSKLTPQQRRRYERLSEKTGRDYSIRNPTFRLNMNMKDIAKFSGLDKNRFYNKLPRSIREAQVNKQFYGNPMKKGWHSSQRTGRGQGLKDISSELPAPIRGVPGGRTPDMGPEPDWLGSLYRDHNISGGKLDQGARDYWSNEAKTKGRDAAIQAIIGTSKAQGTYGGRKKPRHITTGRTPNKKVQSYLDARFANSGHGYPSKAERERRKSLNLQNKGSKRRMGSLLSNTIAAAMAARG